MCVCVFRRDIWCYEASNPVQKNKNDQGLDFDIPLLTIFACGPLNHLCQKFNMKCVSSMV